MERIFVTVKTYPALSSSYMELVCTAGLRENGEWVRIYPITFRTMDKLNQYKKYQWISIDLKKRTKDFRPESFSPVDIDEIRLEEEVRGWTDRWEIIRKSEIFTNLTHLIESSKKENGALSLATFKPSKVKSFSIRPSDRDWPKDRLAKVEALRSQRLLFDDDEDIRRTFEVVRKVPYDFYYEFEDKRGRKSKLRIEDWEIGALYWNCVKSSLNEKEALEKVRAKYEGQLMKNDLYFFLGTIFRNHAKNRPNPFSIIGVFYPKSLPEVFQQKLF